MGSKYVRPEHRDWARGRVVAHERISPHFLRVTIAGPGLVAMTSMGDDQWFRLFFCQDGQDELQLPTATSNLWYPQWLLMKKDKRPFVRNYTIREYRPAGQGIHGADPEIDIDFADHSDIGAACRWAASVPVGQEVALLDEGKTYQPTAGVAWQLFVGDESALPAIAGILRDAPEDLRAVVIMETPSAADRLPLRELPKVRVQWVDRTGDHPGVAALAELESAELPQDRGYAFVAGEQALATGARRHLVGHRGFAKSDVTFTGFWRIGKASPGSYPPTRARTPRGAAQSTAPPSPGGRQARRVAADRAPRPRG